MKTQKQKRFNRVVIYSSDEEDAVKKSERTIKKGRIKHLNIYKKKKIFEVLCEKKSGMRKSETEEVNKFITSLSSAVNVEPAPTLHIKINLNKQIKEIVQNIEKKEAEMSFQRKWYIEAMAMRLAILMKEQNFFVQMKEHCKKKYKQTPDEIKRLSFEFKQKVKESGSHFNQYFHLVSEGSDDKYSLMKIFAKILREQDHKNSGAPKKIRVYRCRWLICGMMERNGIQQHKDFFSKMKEDRFYELFLKAWKQTEDRTVLESPRRMPSPSPGHVSSPRPQEVSSPLSTSSGYFSPGTSPSEPMSSRAYQPYQKRRNKYLFGDEDV